MNTSNITDKHGDDSIDTESRLSEMDKSQDNTPQTVVIEVNSHKVKMLEGLATGLEIKEAAIKQNIAIHLNFVLQLELSNGAAKIIGDDDKVPLRDHLRFTAIEPDDNS